MTDESSRADTDIAAMRADLAVIRANVDLLPAIDRAAEMHQDVREMLADLRKMRTKKLKLPKSWTDETSEKSGMMFGIVGAPKEFSD